MLSMGEERHRTSQAAVNQFPHFPVPPSPSHTNQIFPTFRKQNKTSSNLSKISKSRRGKFQKEVAPEKEYLSHVHCDQPIRFQGPRTAGRVECNLPMKAHLCPEPEAASQEACPTSEQAAVGQS